MLNHEPHETHERWRQAGSFGAFAGPTSDPRLRRALGALPQGWPSSEPALQASLRRRLRLGHDATPPAGSESACGVKKEVEWTARSRRSRTPVSKQGSAEQARLRSGDPRRAPGRRMPDGWTRQRLRTAVSGQRQEPGNGGSPFVGFVWFVAIKQSVWSVVWSSELRAVRRQSTFFGCGQRPRWADVSPPEGWRTHIGCAQLRFFV